MEKIWSICKNWSWKTFGGIFIGISLINYSIFGIKYFFGLIIGIFFFFVGVTLKLYQRTINEPISAKMKRRIILERKSKHKLGLKIPGFRNKLDMRITGSAIIDETIHEMIDYILRDYLHSWYDEISDNDEFIYELRKIIQETLVSLSNRVKEIDWIPFLTTQLVDDGASHLRLYRTALAKTKENPNNDLISIFFDLEATMEEKQLCRDMVAIDESHLQDYFQGIVESILYLILPQEAFNCSTIGVLAQDLLVNHVFIPLLNILSDPDFVNQTIIWLCHEFPITSEIFLTVIRTSDTIDEVTACQDFCIEQTDECKKLLNSNAHDERKNSARQQLKSLGIVRKVVDQRLSQLKEGKNGDWTDDGEQWITPGMKIHNLGLEQILKNSVAVSYFLDYMTIVNGNHYLLMYLNAEAWKASAIQQFTAIENLNKDTNKNKEDQNQNINAMLECMKTAALNIMEQFLSEKSVHRVKLQDGVNKRLQIHIRSNTINQSFFDEVQESLFEIMEENDKYYPSFTRHKLYVKCLMELELLKDESVSNQGSGDKSGSDDDDADVVSLDEEDILVAQNNEIQNDYQTCIECMKLRQKNNGMNPQDILSWEKTILEKKYLLKAEIIEAGIMTEKGKQFGIYAVSVTKSELNESSGYSWHIYRRYSDFYDFHVWIKSKWMRLQKIDFPGKNTFSRTDRTFLEKRMNALNKYLSDILSTSSDPCFGESLQDSLLHFLEPGNYVIKKKQFSEKIGKTLVPLRQSVKSAIKSVPDTLFNTMDGFTKMFHSKNDNFETIKVVGASLDADNDNIPLRIILLLMDEVFDLKSRHQWLRRRIVAIIREILKAMMGDVVNRRIIDYVAYLTSPIRVSGYLKTLQRELWPKGRKITPPEVRDPETKMRTRVAAKSSLFATISDEIKHLIGSQTTRNGLLLVFELCQNRVLNKRLLLVLFEGILKTLFPDKPLPNIIQRLHFRSNRVGKNRPFLVASPTNTGSSLQVSNSIMANLSPRGSRKRK